jgi:hypothetical protein
MKIRQAAEQLSSLQAEHKLLCGDLTQTKL